MPATVAAAARRVDYPSGITTRREIPTSTGVSRVYAHPWKHYGSTNAIRCTRNHVRMPLLREAPSPDTLADLNRHVAARYAHDALDRRLCQLEAEHEAFQRTLVNVERAVKWLPDRQRAGARRRLRELGLEEQPGPFADLHAVIEDAA